MVIRVIEGPSVGVCAQITGTSVLGREGDIRLRDPAISRQHLRIAGGADGIVVSDLGSTSGSALNGTPLTGSAPLRAGDRLQVGQSTLIALRLVRFHDAAAEPAVRVEEGDTTRVMPIGPGIRIGRDADNDLRLDDPSVSRHHARISADDHGVHVEDLHSANGTTVDGRAVVGHAVVADGAVVRVGASPARLRVTHGRATAAAATVRVHLEGHRRGGSVRIDATRDATVAEVTERLAALLGAPDDRPYLIYRGDGVLLHPDDRWSSVGTRRGDEIFLGEGDATALRAEPGRVWPAPPSAGLSQLPRSVVPPETHREEQIDVPDSTSFRGRGIIWQITGGIGAVAVGLLLALVRPEYAVFGLISGSIGVVTIAASILGDQSRRRFKVKEYRRALERLDRRLGETRRTQRATLEDLAPDAERIRQWMHDGDRRLWERRPSDPDALVLTLGRANAPARIDVDQGRRNESALAAELHAVVQRHRELADVPALGPSIEEGSIGLVGPIQRTAALMRSLVVEAAAQLPPGQLRIRVAAQTPEWSWARWLPHVAPGGCSTDPADARELISEALVEFSATKPDEPSRRGVCDLVVIPNVLDDDTLAALGQAIRGHGLLIAAAPTHRSLPGGLATTLTIGDGDIAELSGAGSSNVIGPVHPRAAGVDVAEEIAVGLGRLSDREATEPPSGLVELIGLGSASTVDVAEAWQRRPTNLLSVSVGSDDRGAPINLGFRTDGPHGMIAGTTGSGKSELLQTLLAGLALTHPPDVLTMFLIDFKGGATFAPLSTLPHVVGSVTDLEHDDTLAMRAFTALDAEIERRKRILETARVPNLIDYERLGAEHEPLPNLLVVIDEFALLVERQPEVKDRLDTVATQGRSLGIHLLLATQSPSGVITHAIRTNTNLWVCLRVVSDSESIEILGNRDAARIPDGSPGRAIVRLGAGDDRRSFQAARIGRPLEAGGDAVRVTWVDKASAAGMASPSAQDEMAGRVRSELEVVVERIVDHAERSGIAPARQLWLSPLRDVIPVADIERPPVDPERLEVLLGVADYPERQTQEPFRLDLTDVGHVLVSGVLGSGRTSTLLQVGADVAAHRSPADVHVYGIDAGTGSLGPLRVLPHCGDVVGVVEVERLTRLIDRLGAEVDRRRDRLATAGIAQFTRWRTSGGDLPWILVLVDDFPAFREAAEQIESGRPVERFSALLQNGPAVGIHVVVAVNQSSDMRLREQSLIGARFVLRSSDASDFTLADMRFRPNEVPTLGPGRGYASGGVLVQVAWSDPSEVAQRSPRWDAVPPTALPRAVERLPTSIRRAELPADDRLLLGLGGLEIEPVAVDLHRPLLVAGPLQSGRSTALLSLAAALEHETPHRTLAIALRHSPLRDLPDDGNVLVATTPDEVLAGLDAIVESPQPGDLVLIDDAESIGAVYGAGDRLEQILRDAATNGTRLAAAFRSNDLPGLFDPWARYLVGMRRAVLLQPTQDDLFPFGVKLPVIPPPAVPGRGILIEGPTVTVVQVADGT